jgi:glycerol kinase
MILAIDAGTTGVTAIAVDNEGKIVARGYQEFPQHFPQPGWVEHNLEEIWAAVKSSVQQVIDVVGNEFKALGITNQRETVGLWNKESLVSPRNAIVCIVLPKPMSSARIPLTP